ncbi:MAG: SDR family oxidoreductase [Pseudomonadota bacterium]
MGDRLKDKVAIITGAGSGVGRSCMTLFAAEGAKVVGCSRTQSALDETLDSVKSAGGEGIVVSADLSDSAQCQKVIDAAVAEYGRVDILVHSAGVGWSWGLKSEGSMDDVAATSDEKWREVMGINLDACFYMCRGVIPLMQKQGGGAIVNVGSISGMLGMSTAHTYTAAKGAMINMTRSIAVTYAKDNIRCNCVAPGHTDTPMIAPVMSVFDDPEMAERLNPMSRAGTPDEMAYACLVLADDDASYISGVLLPVDGGKTARQFNG